MALVEAVVTIAAATVGSHVALVEPDRSPFPVKATLAEISLYAVQAILLQSGKVASGGVD